LQPLLTALPSYTLVCPRP